MVQNTHDISFRGRKWTAVIFFLLFAGCNAGFSQGVTIQGKALPLTQVFSEIKKQTHYVFLFSPKVIHNAHPVDLHVKHVPIEKVLDLCFIGQNIEYNLNNGVITLFEGVKEKKLPHMYITGRVVGADNEPLEGAIVLQEGTARWVTSNADGFFNFPTSETRVSLIISMKGYAILHVIINNKFLHVIILEPTAINLNQLVVRGYGRTTRKLSIGSFSELKASDLAEQPVSNVLGAMEGRVPGLFIQQRTGVPGGAYGVKLRGKSSIEGGTDMLVVLDGMPLGSGSGSLSIPGSGSALGITGASGLNCIDPSMIATIEVLKDAAATAIYGSRGANGVILITLKHGNPGRLKWDIDNYAGVTRVLQPSPLLDTRQYLAMRKEATLNAGLALNTATLPEAYLWDTTRNTDFTKLVIGNTGTVQHTRISVSGGDTNHVFLFAGSHNWESSVFPGNTGDRRINLYGNYRFQSGDKRLKLQLSEMGSWETCDLPAVDPTAYRYLAPNAPAFYDSAHRPLWSYKGVSFFNIDVQRSNIYHGDIRNWLHRVQLSYLLKRELTLKGSIGYNTMQSEEESRQPIISQDPDAVPAPLGHVHSAKNTYKSEMVEITAEYNRRFGNNRFEALVGATWQQERKDYLSLAVDDYSSDLQMNIGNGNPATTLERNRMYYKYEALFGRMDLNFYDKYLLTASLRRDGSSRFSPGRQFGNFWALGAGWIFSDESWMKPSTSWLSLGKIRGSYGTTGNDQIGDYKYVQVYNATNSVRGYQGMQGFYPATFFNNTLGWEVNRKAELALELAFLRNRISLSASCFRNTTGNLVVYQALSSQAGLPRALMNQPVKVLNTGVELAIQSLNYTDSLFRWSSSFTFTMARNRLAHFPGLSTSSYKGFYRVGSSLDEFIGYVYTGVDPQTGLFTVRNANGGGIPGPGDLAPAGHFDPVYYGGMENTLRYKSWELSIFLEYRKQKGMNPFVQLYRQSIPGSAGPSMKGNVPVEMLGYWHHPGDRAMLQQFSAMPDGTVMSAADNFTASSATVTDASFLRLKSLSLSYRLPPLFLWKGHLTEGRIYLRGQNLLTWTSFPVMDPETQDINILPPVKTIVLGFQCSF